MTTVVYTGIAGGYDSPIEQIVPVRLFTDETHPRPEADPRLRAKWWKFRPDLMCPDADVTIWIDGNIRILRPDFPEMCVRALGDADALFMRHPQRDCIHQEVIASRHLHKYDGWPLEEQADHYMREGHPEHWGLAHAAVLVRRNCEQVKRLGEAWWEEMTWSLQDQISLPPLLRTSPLRYRWWVQSPIETGYLHWDGGHCGPNANVEAKGPMA